MVNKIALTPKHHDYIRAILFVIAIALTIAYFWASSTQGAAYIALAHQLSQTQASLNGTQANLTTAQANFAGLNATYIALKANYTALIDRATSNFTTGTYVETIVANNTVLVPRFQYTIPFYNSALRVYNNFTSAGVYNQTFTVPYDGYLVVRVQSVSAYIGTYGFIVSSNSSGSALELLQSPTTSAAPPPSPSNAPNPSNPQPPVQNLATGFFVIPNQTTVTFTAPIRKGPISFNIYNTNGSPIRVVYSITYVAEGTNFTIPRSAA